MRKVLKIPISFWFDEDSDSTVIAQNGNGNKSQIGNDNIIIDSQANEIEHFKSYYWLEAIFFLSE